MLTFIALVLLFLLAVVMAPFLAFGWWTSVTPTGAQVYDGINWVLNHLFQLVGGGIVWAFAVFCLCLFPFILDITTMSDKSFDGSAAGTFGTLLTSAIPSILLALFARWALPFAWPRRILFAVLILSLLVQGVKALKGMWSARTAKTLTD